MKFWKYALLGMVLILSNSVNAAIVSLNSGAVDPYNTGFVPVPPNEPIPFSDSDIALMSDGDNSTGLSFTSNAGDFSSQSFSVVGFGKAFNFDVSGYQDIERIDFTWTGKYAWDGLNSPLLRFGPSTPEIAAQESFGTSSAPDNLTHTVNVSFFSDSTGFDSLSRILQGDNAQIWVSTNIGHSTSQSTITFVTMETLEVSANIVGTVVPVPAAVWLFGSGLIGLVSFARRK